jgi:hypothetical protein
VGVKHCEWYDGHPSSVCRRPQAVAVMLVGRGKKMLCEMHARRLSCPT